MRKNSKSLLLVMLLCTIMILMQSTAVLANSARLPSLVILVNNPPADLSIVAMFNENQEEAVVQRVAWEGYYGFYPELIQVNGKYTFKVTTNGECFECIIDTPLQRYDNVFTLNISDRKLTPGTYPLRSALLIFTRLLLTLLLEGIIFWFCGFRKKRSWIIFLYINLVTQGILNIWLNSAGPIRLLNYLILGLIIGEFFVFLTEMIAFPILIKEHGKMRSFIYAFIANFISLIAGGYILSILPV